MMVQFFLLVIVIGVAQSFQKYHPSRTVPSSWFQDGSKYLQPISEQDMNFSGHEDMDIAASELNDDNIEYPTDPQSTYSQTEYPSNFQAGYPNKANPSDSQSEYPSKEYPTDSKSKYPNKEYPSDSQSEYTSKEYSTDSLSKYPNKEYLADTQSKYPNTEYPSNSQSKYPKKEYKKEAQSEYTSLEYKTESQNKYPNKEYPRESQIKYLTDFHSKYPHIERVSETAESKRDQMTAATGDNHGGRVQIKVYRGPDSGGPHEHFAPYGYWVKQPADYDHH